jgi:hypothetical protein
VTFERLEQDGSGSVTAEMSNLYLKSKTTPRPTRKGGQIQYPRPPRSRCGYLHTENLIDLGIRAKRAFAADYSGRCGAPGLFVVVDQIKDPNGLQKTWRMHLKQPQPKGGVYSDHRVENNWYNVDPIPKRSTWIDGVSVQRQGNRFLCTQERTDATLAVTFIPAKGLVAEHEDYVQSIESYDRKQFHGFNKIIRNAIMATGSDEYFVVMTLQRGKAPEVRWAGEGLGAIVTVGGQTVRFDGEKIVLSN